MDKDLQNGQCDTLRRVDRRNARRIEPSSIKTGAVAG
jgi:hypothetical protein